MASQERHFEPSSGWDEQLDNNDHQNLSHKLIDLANSKVSLETIFSQYNLNLEPHYSTTGWAFRSTCPFPDHNDRTPSFGYNPSVGIFNCFGCHRGGQAVEFIANMSGRRRSDVARELVGNYSNDEVILHNSKFDFERLRELLFDFADAIRVFKNQNNNQEAALYAKAVTWNFDVYLRKNAPLNTIILDDLEVRIVRLKKQLAVYGV